MRLTEDRYAPYKADYVIQTKATQKDAYGAEYTTTTDGDTIHVMWTPVSDVSVIETYGERVINMLQCVLYGTANVKHGDQVDVYDETYQVVQIKRYQTHRVIVIERLAK
jgi:hypothetical protein